ncbi:tau 95 subunit of transcription factor TFIIIC [Sporothrix stenoceras]|uniref:Tau 95 subunit of transcription factor TFIIIC n=1 Tax=Sporothrix stenoceras TaxID=5173 RepID=A0ABR3Z7E5_9PEZI
MDVDVTPGNGPAGAGVVTSTTKSTAPVLAIPKRPMAALEHPALLTSLQRGIDSFANRADYGDMVHPAGPQSSTSVFLRQEDPSASGLSSHCAATHNVVLAVHVPKRTGMRRKRGTNDAWEFDPSAGNDAPEAKDNLPGDTIAERDARRLRRKLQETSGLYRTEVVGIVKNSHRFRGLVDFQQSSHDSAFMNKFKETVLPGELSKLRDFKLESGVAQPPSIDLPAPPFFTSQALPFSYSYSQNPFVREIVSGHDGAVRLINSTAANTVAGYLLAFDELPVPTAPPPGLAPIVGRRRLGILETMRQALVERPVWTRRALVNHMAAKMGLPFTENRLKQYFIHCCYQFKGGPWRDSLVSYGVDPRSGPSFRQYQTLLFKLHRHVERKDGYYWHSLVEAEDGAEQQPEDGVRKGRHVTTPLNTTDTAPPGAITEGEEIPITQRKDTHIFDGRNYCDDGKIWQVCDLHDPILRKLLADAPTRPTCERLGSGWYHQGTWAQARAIMKIRLLSIRFGRILDEASFAPTLSVPPQTPRMGTVRTIKVPVPNLELTAEENAVITMRVYHGRPKKRVRQRVTSVTLPIFTEKRDDVVEEEAGENEENAAPKDGVQGNGTGDAEDDEEEDEVEDIEDLGDDDEEDNDNQDGGNDDEDEDEDDDDDEEEEEDEGLADRIAVKEEILDDMDRSGLDD